MRDLLPRDYSSSGVVINGRDLGENLQHWKHPFRQLIGALRLSQSSGIRELRIEPFNGKEPSTPFTFDFFDYPDASDIQAGRWLFQNLVKCELNFRILTAGDNTPLWYDRDNGRRKLAHLSHLLAATDDLRHLTLHIVGWQSAHNSAPHLELGPSQPVFSRLGLRKTWSKLRSFNLGGVHSLRDEFLEFIRRHKGTLWSLSFQDCTLCSGSWADIVDEVVYSTSVCRFVLLSVNEAEIPTGNESVQSSEGLEEWKYEGCLEVSKDGEHKYVSPNLSTSKCHF